MFKDLLNKLRAPWILNSDNKPDAMLTFSLIGLLAACWSLVISIIDSVTVGNVIVELNKPDTTLVLGILSATLGSYVWRRGHKAKLSHIEKMNDKE